MYSTFDTTLEIINVSKRFGNLDANDQITFAVNKGEVLALLGENGAGKTTLMNILFGHYVADEGEIKVNGESLPPGSPSSALEYGIGMVHQHFTLADNLSVIENVVLGTESLIRPHQNLSRAKQHLSELAEKFGLKVNPDNVIADLSVGEKQRVEILKALYRGSELLILDEPTAVLTPQEATHLFSALRSMVNDGMSIIFISHKLSETYQIADRVAVLRQGRLVDIFEPKTTSHNELAQAMVGRSVRDISRSPSNRGKVLCELSGAVVEHEADRPIRNANLTIYAGEVLGIAGVSGNGQRTLTGLLFGEANLVTGRFSLFDQVVTRNTTREMIDKRVARVPEDRGEVGVIGEMTIDENLVLEDYGRSRFQKWGWLLKREIKKHADDLCNEFDVRGSTEAKTARTLSGGNLQKLILARVLSKEPRLIIASQPTRGLDIGAASEVHQRLLAARASGVGVFVVSEDLEELLTLCDRISVMFEGNISTPIPIEEASIQKLGLMMAGEDIDKNTKDAI